MDMPLLQVFVILLAFSAISFSTAFLSQSRMRVQGTKTAPYSTICLAAKEIWEDERDEDIPYRTRYSDGRARELQNLRYETDDETLDIVKDDYYYDDEDEDRETYEEEDDFYIDEKVRDEYIDDSPTGNFWYNPKQGVDPLPSSKRKPSKLEQETEFHAERRPRPRPKGTTRPKTTFRSGEPSTPEPITDFYDRLFWYGFNPDESIAPGDKTLFGGTKGKFNGLDFFEDDERRKPSRKRPRKRPPQQFRADAWYDDIMDSLDDYEEADGGDYVTEMPVKGAEFARSRRRRSLPPQETYFSYDEDDDMLADTADEPEKDDSIVSETVRRNPSADARPRRRRPRPTRDDAFYEEEEEEYRNRRPRNGNSTRRRPTSKRKSGDRIAERISTWFGPDDVDYEPDDYSRSPRRRRRPQQYIEDDDDDDESWSITNVLDGIFGVNRRETDMNAAMYNKQMGLDRSARSQRRPRERTRRRQSYVENHRDGASSKAYRNEENDFDILDNDVVDVDAIIEEEDDTIKQPRRRERTVEERAAAFERVPPSGVPAWGPSGAVGVDARTKATLDALEEIREATRKVELKEEECIEAKEDVVIGKADFTLQKKRLLANLDDPDQIRSRLRQMKLGVQDAAHNLRRCRAELEVARDRLADLQDRNWALLSLYDADKAFQEVVETFREFEESERLETRVSDELAHDTDVKPSESLDVASADSNGKESPENESEEGDSSNTASSSVADGS